MALLAMPFTYTYGPAGDVHTFNSSSRSRISVRPLEDDAQRAIKANQWEVQIVEILQDDSSLNATMVAVRRQLTAQAGLFTMTGNGVGNFQVNVAGGTKDVMFGPRCTLNIVNNAAAAAVQIEWTCRFALPPECAAARDTGLMAMGYAASYEINKSGLTRRTIEGHIEIALNRVRGARRIPDIVDAWRDNIDMPCPPGFQREQRTFHESLDKRRLDFTLVDQELACGGLPPSCVSATGQMAVASQPPMTIQFGSTVSASYVLAPGKKRSDAYEAFRALVEDRYAQLIGNRKTGIFTAFRFTEGLYENANAVTFEQSWMILSSSIEQILGHSGAFRPVPKTNWQQWQASLPEMFDNRGPAGMKSVNNDTILDLCAANKDNVAGGIIRFPAPQNQIQGIRPLANSAILEADSWVHYDCEIAVIRNGNLCRLKTLPDGQVVRELRAATPAELSNFQSQYVNGFIAQPGNPGQLVNDASKHVDTIQSRTSPAYKVILKGEALRIGFECGIPALSMIGGVKVNNAAFSGASKKVVGNLNGLPLWYSAWYKMYLVPEVPDGGINPPANPSAGFR